MLALKPHHQIQITVPCRLAFHSRPYRAVPCKCVMLAENVGISSRQLVAGMMCCSCFFGPWSIWRQSTSAVLHLLTHHQRPGQLLQPAGAVVRCCCPPWCHVSSRDRAANTREDSNGHARLLFSISFLLGHLGMLLLLEAAVFGRLRDKVAMAAATIRFSRLLLPPHRLRRAGKQQAAAGGPSGGSRRPFSRE